MKIEINTNGAGLYHITNTVNDSLTGHLPQKGMCHIFIQHTSASLLIQENADPTAKLDLETFLEKIAPQNQSWHRHTLEGPDDTTSHMRSAITQTSLSIPVIDGQLSLGTWQGIYLCEHRESPHTRKLILTVMA